MSAGTLYVVATPLGNLQDLSARAARVLCEVPLVAAEDTRRTRVLLQHIGASPKVLSFHAHSTESRLGKLIDVLQNGGDVALVTDAGTPTISDPGVALVRAARHHAIPIVVVPGPSAGIAALSVSGLPGDRHTFLGFLPRSGKDRRRLLETVAASRWTTVIFEAPTRLGVLLEGLAKVCGANREAAVARELTKVHEEVNLGTLSDLAVYYEQHPPRGEVTVVVSGSPQDRPTVTEEEIRRVARGMLDDGASRRDTADRVATDLGISRREVYRIVNEL